MPPPALAHLGVEVPLAFEQLVQRLLTKPPAGRVQSADELIRAIDAVIAEPGPATALPTRGARPVSATPSMTTLSGASTSRRLPAALRSVPGRSVAIVAGTAAAVTVAIVAVVMLRGGDEPPVIAARAAAPRSPIVAPAPVEPPAPPVVTAPPPVDDSAAIELTPAPAKAAAPAPAAPEPAKPAAPAPVKAAAPGPVKPIASQAAKPIAPEPAKPDPAKPAAPVGQPTHDAKPVPAAPRPVKVAEPPAAVDVAIDSTPSGAQLVFAGKTLGKTPFHGTLPRSSAGATLVVRLAGYADKTVVVHPDHAISERIKLVPAAAPAAKRDQSVNPF
jgi:hypothetical protein